MIPTAILLAVAVFAALRARRVASLRPAAWTLVALFVLDALHHAAEPIADIWRHGGALAPWQTWALRGDAWIVAGAWPGVCAQLTYSSDRCRRPFCYCVVALFGLYGLYAVDLGRGASAETWTALLIAPRIAVGALAWLSPPEATPNSQHQPGVCASGRRVQAFARRRSAITMSPPLLIGKIVAACQVAAAFFLWRRWTDVRLLASACWLACGWSCGATRRTRKGFQYRSL